MVEQGQVTEGINQMRQGIETWRATGSATEQPLQLALLGQAYGQIGMLDEGLALLAEALAIVQRNGERFYEAETTSASKSAMIEGL